MKFIKNNISKDTNTKVVATYSNNSSVSGGSSPTSGGNSSTTEKLAVARKIWGQSFDGSADVSGDMTNVGSITATGNIQTDADLVIMQLDSDGNEVENGELKVSVDDGDANFTNKDRYVFDNEIVSPNGTINSVVSQSITNSGNINNSGNITTNTLTSNNITNSDTIKTKNLEVTGSAHFFELIIDKVKAAGGAAIFTPADGFDVDIVETATNGYKLFWQCDDGNGNQRSNMWKVNDQALCQSFNKAKSGSGVSNKYYWCLVTAISEEPIEKDGIFYNWIVISTITYDGIVNPEKGDSIAMLGYRGTDDSKRQTAIYISAYTSLDKGLTAPLFAQYRGINDFNLESHRQSYFDATKAKFVGDFEVSGQSVEDYITEKIKEKGDTTFYAFNLAYNTVIYDSVNETYTPSYDTEWTYSLNKYEGSTITTLEDEEWIDNAMVIAIFNDSTNDWAWLETPPPTVQQTMGANGWNNNPNLSSVKFVWYKDVNLVSLYDSDYETFKKIVAANGDGTNVDGFNKAPTAQTELSIINKAKDGAKGDDAVFYKMEPTYEYAIVENTKVASTYISKLIFYAQYIIYKQIGNSKTQISPSSSGYRVQYSVNGTSWTNMTIENSMCYIKAQLFYSLVTNKNYVQVRLVDSSNNVLDQKVVPITYSTGAVLTIDQDLNKITTRVSDCEKNIDTANANITTVTNNVSKLEQTADKINAQVEQNTTNINTATGNIESITSDVSKLEQTAKEITTTVTSTKNEIAGDNILRGQNGNGWSGYVNYSENGNSFTLKSTQYTYSTPICDYMGNNLFSFTTWGDNKIMMAVYEFKQTYNTNNSYNVDCDFETYTPCTILVPTATYEYTQYSINTIFYSGRSYIFTVDVPSTISVNDYVAFTIDNLTTNVHNHIYGLVTAIAESRTTFTMTITTVLKPASQLFIASTANADTLEEITDYSTQNNKFHYSEELERYWIRWAESQGTTKTFLMRFNGVGGDAYISNCMLEEYVTRPHRFSQQSQITQSMIKQTAEEIKMSVNNTYLKIGDGNITLNGDTKVVGNLTLTESTQGFTLLGSNGRTDIIADSIGTYNSWEQKTDNIVPISSSNYFYGEIPFGQTGDIAWSGTAYIELGNMKANDYIEIFDFSIIEAQITNIYNGKKDAWTDKQVIPSSVYAYLIDGNGKRLTEFGLFKKYTTYSYTFEKDTTYVRLMFNVKASYSYDAWKGDADDSGIIEMPKLQFSTFGDVKFPTDAYMLIGCDGWAANFGSGNTVYCGAEGFIASYSGNTFKITSDGIEHLNKRTVKVVSGASYTVESPIDTVLCTSGNCYITLPTSPYQGQEVKIYDKATNTYLTAKVGIVERNTSSSTTYTNKELDGFYPRTYTYINGKWYEEYSG